jgi:hypothetical protein
MAQNVKAVTMEEFVDMVKVDLRECNGLLNAHKITTANYSHCDGLARSTINVCLGHTIKTQDESVKDANVRFRQSGICEDPLLTNYINARGIQYVVDDEANR